ncbi:hypothetical protein [uncultured Neptuniibacter sp.]|nr:hypothetical protein [uncultured Neptuniibacter sp.]
MNITTTAEDPSLGLTSDTVLLSTTAGMTRFAAHPIMLHYIFS